jgi:spermidine synthase
MPYKKILSLMFFCSGFCGLLYQIVWMRLAFAAFGINTPVLSVVISVFMMGLALGSWWAGSTVSWFLSRFKIRPIFLYGTIELLIGVGAFLVPFLFRFSADVLLKLGEMDSFGYLLASALFIVLSIIPWCLCMGATYPFMMAFIKENTASHSTSFSFLYISNVVGAMAGTLVTVGALIELLGFSGTLALGALLNFTVAFLAIELGFRTDPKKGAVSAKVSGRAAQSSAAPLFNTKTAFPLAILFLTGFCSMAMEVVWTRDFTPILKTQVYSFAMILFTYLLATWVGSLFYRRTLAWKQVLSNEMLLVYLALCSFFPVVLTDPRFNKTVITMLLTLAPICAILGYLTPKLIDDISAGQPKLAGKAYAVNVVGCILGPLFASYLFLPWVGAQASLVILCLPFIVLTFFHWKKFSLLRLAPQMAAFAFLALAVFYSQSYETLEKGETRRDHVATVISTDSGMGKRLLINGVGTTHLTPITKFMAHLPLSLLDHKPEKALVICFGMGGTFRSLLSWDIDVTAVELVPSVPKAFGYYYSNAAELVKRPNAKIVIDDGRRFLKRTGDLYDVITIDPPPPVEAAGSSLLYSKGFFDLVKLRLKKGGLLMQWWPGGENKITDAVARSLMESFPYVKTFPPFEGGGIYYVASMDPITIPSEDEMIAKMPPAAREDLMEWAGNENLENYARKVFTGGNNSTIPNPNPRVVITDEIPYNEYFYLRRNFPGTFSFLL